MAKTINSNLRWTQHPENSSLVQLQFKQCGLWYTIEGTTVNTLADALKFSIMQRYSQALGVK